MGGMCSPGQANAVNTCPLAVKSTCEVYTVKTGDTMSSIAATYTAAGKKVTAEQICAANGKLTPVNTCNHTDMGDDYMIPFEGSDSTCSMAADKDFFTIVGGTSSTTGGSDSVGQVSSKSTK